MTNLLVWIGRCSKNSLVWMMLSMAVLNSIRCNGENDGESNVVKDKIGTSILDDERMSEAQIQAASHVYKNGVELTNYDAALNIGGSSKDRNLAVDEIILSFQRHVAGNPLTEETQKKLLDEALKVADNKENLEEALDSISAPTIKSRRVIDTASFHREKRNFLPNENNLWEKGIVPYVFNEDNAYATGPWNRRFIKKTFTFYERISCLTFPKFYKGLSQKHNLRKDGFLNIGDYGGGACYSFVGKHNGGQRISACAFVHELGHAVGMHHEHQRADRDNYIKVYPENVNPAFLSTTGKISAWYDHSVPYDYASAMHYGLTSFSAVGRLVYDVIDKSERFLLGSNRGFGLSFYDIMTINQGYKCAELKCPGKKLNCKNSGFPAYVEQECRCYCPPSLGGDDCDEIWKPKKTSLWPTGSYGFPSPSSGCQGGLGSGQITHSSTVPSRVYKEPLAFPDDIIEGKMINEKFCMISNAKGGPWPAGEYCIYKNSATCPDGFKNGSITWDDVEIVNNTRSGSLPDGDFTNGTKINYCCRNDGDPGHPIRLPTRKPIVLIPIYAGTCQLIEGMGSNIAKMDYRSRNKEAAKTAGMHPFIWRYKNGFHQEFCYYYPINFDCGGVIELNSVLRVAEISSPNYPNNYFTNGECAWLIKAPDNAVVQLRLANMDIHIGSGSGCKHDYLEVRKHLPGQYGQRYCGQFDNYNRTFTSKYNHMILVFKSDYKDTGKGFKGTVRMITESDFCYNVKNDGIFYRGSVNYSQTYEPCLSWEKVTHCKYHAHTNSAVDKGLSGGHNYCRNPSSLARPWCYTQSQDCKQDSCDSCLIEECHDVFDDCDELIKEDPDYCNNEKSAFIGCHKSCGLCENKLPGIGHTTCQGPNTKDAILTSQAKSNYSVGDVIVYKCKFGDGKFKRVCTSDGTWSGVDDICHGCLPGSVESNNNCYFLHRGKLSYDMAETYCQNMGYHTIWLESEEEKNFIVKKLPEDDPFINRSILTYAIAVLPLTWVPYKQKYKSPLVFRIATGIRRSKQDVNKWVWTSGFPVNYTNWAWGQPTTGHNCSRLRKNGIMEHQFCELENPFVCKGRKPVVAGCVDRYTGCGSMLLRSPLVCQQFSTFSDIYCKYTCGICTKSLPGTCKNNRHGRWYNGKVNHTKKGYTCQRWDSQKPHSHTRNNPKDFPEATVTEAQNYCRNPDWEPKGPWCYIATPRKGRWDYCDISTCGKREQCDTPTAPRDGFIEKYVVNSWINQTVLHRNTSRSLVAGDYVYYSCNHGFERTSGDATRLCLQNGDWLGSVIVCKNSSQLSRIIGSYTIPRKNRDKIGIATIDDSLKIPIDGEITAWRIYSNIRTSTYLQVWEKLTENNFKLVGQNKVETRQKRSLTFKIPANKRISAYKGFYIGLYTSKSESPIPYSPCVDKDIVGYNDVIFTHYNQARNEIPIGQIFGFGNNSKICRNYSVEAIIDPRIVVDSCQIDVNKPLLMDPKNQTISRDQLVRYSCEYPYYLNGTMERYCRLGDRLEGELPSCVFKNPCAHNWTYIDGRCYKKVSNKGSWTNAASYCLALGKDVFLGKIRDRTNPFFNEAVNSWVSHVSGNVVPANLCKTYVRAKTYRGRVSQTRKGFTCQRWDTQTPHRHTRTNPRDFPELTLSDAENYCRNPDNEPKGPWCYIATRGKGRWDYCDVPLCSKSDNIKNDTCMSVGSGVKAQLEECNVELTALCEIESVCPQGFERFRNRCFHRSKKALNWENAQLVCRRWNGYLVTVADDDTRIWLEKDLLSTHKTNYWIGLNDKKTNTEYVWVENGKVSTFYNWGKAWNSYQKPSNYDSRNCVHMMWGAWMNYKWSDEPCYTRYNYVCETNVIYKDGYLKKCSTPKIRPNTTITFNKKLSYNLGEVVTYSCVGFGYQPMSAHVNRSCLGKEIWAPEAPVCKYAGDIVEEFGSPGLGREIDGANWIHLFDALYTIHVKSKIIEWKFKSRVNSTVFLQIWRPSKNNSKEFTLVGQNELNVTTGENILNIKPEEQISVRPGDRIAQHTIGHRGAVTYDPCWGGHNYLVVASRTKITKGSKYTMSPGNWYKCRHFRLQWKSVRKP